MPGTLSPVLSRRILLGGGAATLSAAPAAGQRRRPPNILFLISDDHSYPHLGCYGDSAAKTPQIDRLAAEGMRFSDAFASAPQCSPSRSSYYSGCIPHSIGTSRQASFYPERQPSVLETLKELGYRTAAFGKVHQGTAFDRRFDDRSDDVGKFATFLERAPAGRPFFAQIGYREPHRPYARGGRPAPPEPPGMGVPEFLPDTPEVRGDLAEYYAEIAVLDGRVGEALVQLRKHGVEDNTLVVFMGDNGMPFPRAKGTLYEAGVRVPLIVRWPGVVRPDSKSAELASGMDLAATFVEAANGRPPEWVQGSSLGPALRGESAGVRQAVFAERNWHNHFDPMRCVRTKRYKLIYNGRPEMPYRPTSDVEQSPSWRSYVAQQHTDRGVLKPHHWTLLAPSRPWLEFYDLEKDPEERVNRAADPDYAEPRQELEWLLSDWMHETSDFLPPLYYDRPARRSRRRLTV